MQAAIRKTLEPQYQIKKKTGMCLGWVSQQEKSTNPPIYWHAGGTRGSASLLAVCPQAQFAVAMLANYGSFASLWGNIRVARANFNAIFREIASARMPGA